MKYFLLLFGVAILSFNSYAQLCTSPVTAVEGVNTVPSAPYWFSYTAPRNESVTITSAPTGTDTHLVVPTDCSQISFLINNDNIDGTTVASYGTLSLTAGQTILIGWLDTNTPAGFTWQLMTEPEIDYASPNWYPANNATNVPVDVNNLVMPFKKNIYSNLVSGAYVALFKTNGDSLVHRYTVDEVTAVGNELHFKANIYLQPNTSYYFYLAPNAVIDQAATDFWVYGAIPSPDPRLPMQTGITDPALWTFTTGTTDANAPGLLSTYPANKATKIGIKSNLMIAFTEPITYNSPANISVYDKVADVLVSTIDLAQNGTIHPENIISIDINGILQPATEYYITIPNNTIFDLTGKAFAGIPDSTVWSFTTAFPVNTTDSLALVAIYNATDGNGWSKDDGWLYDMVESWYGVEVTATRVTGLSLPYNNLIGDLPVETLNLTALTNINIQGNLLYNLPDLAQILTLTDALIDVNYFGFDDIRPLTLGGISNLQYTPQKPYSGDYQKFLKVGNNYVISLPPLPGTAVAYTWYKDGVLIPGETLDSLSLINFQLTDAGGYTRHATSPDAPAVELVSGVISIVADTTTTANTSIFEWITSGTIVDDIAVTSYGSSWIDIENDGDEDLFVTHWLAAPAQPDYLYLNNGDGTFFKDTSLVITNIYAQRYVSWGDFDNDGLIDMLGHRNNAPMSVFRNTGNVVFAETVLSQFTLGSGAIWADVNADGNLDIVQSTFSGGYYIGIKIYFGDGAGGFTDSGTSYPAYSDRNMQVLDYDNDGDMDIFITSHYATTGTPVMLVNDGSGLFQMRTLMNIAGIWSGTWGDIDNDGDLDLFFMSSEIEDGYFMLNDGAGNLTSVPMANLLGVNLRGRGAAFGDINSDGFIDLVTGDMTAQTARLFLNNGDGTFSLVPESQQIFQPNINSGGISLADYDNDGFLDMFFADWDGAATNELYRNRGNGNSWLKIKLEGTLSNRSAIGARVVVNSGGSTMTRVVQSLSSYVTQNSMIAHFGLPTTDTVTATVYWPSGIIQTVNGITPNQQLNIVEQYNAGVPPEDYNALVAFYNATNGPSWTNNFNWMSLAPVESWYGVTVVNNRVTRVSLNGNNLTGFLPAEIGGLTALTYLGFEGNTVGGSIPPEIGQLTNLDTLTISFNNFTGSIPDELYQLTNLIRFSASNNQLTGELSPLIGNLTNLKHIATWNNPISGNIPDEFWTLTQIERVYLGTSQIGGEIPPEIGNMTNMNEFWISFSNLSGQIPPEIGNLTNMVTLRLENNQMSGPVPEELAQCRNLRTLNLENNNFNYLPALNLDSLTDFRISNNEFTFADFQRNASLITNNTAQKPIGDSLVVEGFTFEGLRIDPKMEFLPDNDYQWFKDGVLLPDGTGHYFLIDDVRDTDQGVYTLEIRHPNYPGYVLTRSPITVNLNTGDPPKPRAVEVISPNNDGINDEMTITNIELYPNHRVLIYDVLGRLVFFTTEYDNINNPFIGIGNVNGYGELPSGTYYYLIDVGDTKKNGTGFFIMKK